MLRAARVAGETLDVLPLDEVSQSVSQSVSRARLTAQQSLTYLDEVDILEKLETY